MLEEEGKEGDQQPIDQERQQQPPPLPKRQTPPAGIKSKITTTPPSPPSHTATFIDQPLFSKGDRYQEEVVKLLEFYRQHDGMLESSTLIFEFLDKWIKETKPNAIIFADALFELLLEDYNPATDERLVSRICLVMSQILQRKYTSSADHTNNRRKESVTHLLRICYLAARLCLLYLSNVTVGTDQSRVKASLDFLKTLNAFSLQAASSIPRAFQGYTWDQYPHLDESIKLRFALLGHYCTPVVFTRFKQLVQDYSKLNSREHSVLAMMTLVAEVAYPICKSYKLHKAISKIKDRLRTILGADADLDENYEAVMSLTRDMGAILHAHVINLMRTEENTSILSVAQLTMTTRVLRSIAQIVGPLDIDEPVTDTEKPIAAMKMIARLAFEGFTTETKRQDILNWSVNWYKRQIEIDYGRQYKGLSTEVEAVGYVGLQ